MSNTNDLKDRILDLDIVTSIGAYTELKPTGSNFKGKCPIHQEKTPSFIVSPSKNIFKCFGCGKGGNLIDFIMELKGLKFIEALHLLARENNIPIPSRPLSPDQRKEELVKESILIANNSAMNYFADQLLDAKDPSALLARKYALSRWPLETIKLWNIGFAPDQFQPHKYTSNFKADILIHAGLLKESSRDKKKLYNYFRNRITIPVHDKYGRVIAFSARDISGKEDQPKYINTPDTPVYSKSRVLFGLHHASKSIRQKGFLYLVEGNPDVIKLHEIGIYNTVALSGTSLTPDQVYLISSLCKSVNIIGDSDPAGKKAVQRSADILIRSGIAVNIINLPQDEGKNDPDSFFTDKKHFKDYLSGQGMPKDYIFFLAESWNKKANNPDLKAKALDEIASLVVCFDDPSMHELYCSGLSKILLTKKAWNDKIKLLLKQQQPAASDDDLPPGVDSSRFLKYGFYENKNCYYFKTNKGITRGCNFVMKPLFHVPSVIKAKRLYEITNAVGYTQIIEFYQSDLVSLSRFKERVEGLGNYLWEAGEIELIKLKRYLYENTDTCIEISQLGWQKEGFWAWSNGIFNGTFKPVDKFGIVSCNEKNFYLPPFSLIYQQETNLFTSERKFIHREAKISLHDYSSLLMKVFGDNAMIALCFFFTTLFRDYIVSINNFFPLLNLFGPKGTGKTELAVSILQFFGKQSKGPNINNTSKPALANHVAQLANSCVHIDEYKNNIDFEKVEYLKGLWDGTGRNRMNMDKDKKMETTAVDCSIILSGQEMPTADIALFSRLIFLSFYRTEYTDKEKELFSQLKSIERAGLTHITHDILQHRDYFIENYKSHHEKVCNDINDKLGENTIEDRTFNNWSMILSAFSTLSDKINVPFSYDYLLSHATTQLLNQNTETKKGNEVSNFWKMIQYLNADGLIQEDVDYKVDGFLTLKTDKINMTWDETKTIIFIQHSRIIPLYRKHGRMHGEQVLPANSIDYYLRNDKRFLGKKVVAFKHVDPKTGIEVTDSQGRKKRKITNAYAFLYDDLDLSLTTETDDYDIDENSPLPPEIQRYEKERSQTTENSIPF